MVLSYGYGRSQRGLYVFTVALYRRLKLYALVIKNSNDRIQSHVREGGTTTKIEVTAPITFNAWNLAIWTYAPGTNTIVLEVNDSTTGGVPSDTLTVPYTTDSNMYLGNTQITI